MDSRKGIEECHIRDHWSSVTSSRSPRPEDPSIYIISILTETTGVFTSCVLSLSFRSCIGQNTAGKVFVLGPPGRQIMPALFLFHRTGGDTIELFHSILSLTFSPRSYSDAQAKFASGFREDVSN